jgi:hypothetical protein
MICRRRFLSLRHHKIANHRQLILKHWDANFEKERNVRFWTLAGLYQRGASYLESAVRICLSDHEPEVALLAQAINSPDDSDLISKLRSMLFSDNFEREVWPVLRLLRVLPIQELVKDLCDILDRTAGDTPLAYDVLYALANPPMAVEAAPILQKTHGLDQVVGIIIAVVRDSASIAAHHFARLLPHLTPMRRGPR